MTSRRLFVGGLLALLVVSAAGAVMATAQERSEKQMIEERQAVAVAQAPRATKDPVGLRPSATPDSEWPSGIFEGRQPPFPSSYVRISNHWQSLLDGVYVQVYAGALTSDPDQGLVITVRTSRQGAPLGNQTVFAPRRGGALRIDSAVGSELRLISAAGDTYTFDARAARYLD